MSDLHPLQSYLDARGMSVTALANEVGVGRMTVYRWLRRKRIIDRKLLALVSEKTGISADKLLELDRLTGAPS